MELEGHVVHGRGQVHNVAGIRAWWKRGMLRELAGNVHGDFYVVEQLRSNNLNVTGIGMWVGHEF